MSEKPEEKMEYGFLSRSCGLKVSKVCLGTMTFGESEKAIFKLPGQLNETESHKLLDRFVEMGGNFIDSANMYMGGESEKILGTWLKKQTRSDVVVATKCFSPTENVSGLNDRGLSRNNIVKSVEASLERLNTDYIDLYQVHSFDWGTPQKETLATLNDLVRCGKVRYIGASNFCGWQLMEALNICEQMGLDKYVTLQNQYNLLCRDCELDSFYVCKQKGMGVIPWGSLKSGLLTDHCSIRGEKAAEDSRQAWMSKVPVAKRRYVDYPNYDSVQDDEDFWRLMEVLKEIAANHKKPIAQISLKYLLQKKPVTSVIIGAKRVEQLEDNVKAGYGWSLTDEEVQKLDEASTFGIHQGYPYSNFARHMGDRMNSP